jgi:hypothetical protein
VWARLSRWIWGNRRDWDWGEEEEAMQKYRDPENAGHLRSRWT